MFKFLKEKNKLYCFTPEVMLATFIIEIILAIYVFVRYKKLLFYYLVMGILASLAFFQLAEYQVCVESTNFLWVRIAIISTMFLPIFGLHLIKVVQQNKADAFLRILYIGAILFSGVILFTEYVTGTVVCNGNYIIFQNHSPFPWLYPIYYFGLILWSIIEAYSMRTCCKLKYKSILNWIIIGYLSFLIPSGLVYLLSESSQDNLPSIMCGFALMLAFILVIRVIPLYNKIPKR